MSVCPVRTISIELVTSARPTATYGSRSPRALRVLGLDPAVLDDRGGRRPASMIATKQTNQPMSITLPGAVLTRWPRGRRSRCPRPRTRTARHDHPDREDPFAALAAAQEHVERDRDQHHVAERVGEADRRGDEAVAAGCVDLVEHDHPAAEEHGAGDHHPVDHGADAPGEGLGGAREQQQPDRGERRQPQIADVRVRRERHLAPEDSYPCPDHLAQPPRDRRACEEDPGAPVGVASRRRAAGIRSAPAKAATMSPTFEIVREVESPPTSSTSNAAQAAVIEAATPHARMYRV